MDTVLTLDLNSHRQVPMSDGATDYSPFGNAVCAREAHQYIIPYLPAFVNRMSRNYADYHYDHYGGGTGSTPGRGRTCNLRIRSPLLYPLSYRCIYLYRLYCTKTLELVNVSRCYHTVYVWRGGPAHPKSLRHKGLRQAVIRPFTTGTVAVTSGA